MSIRDAKGRQLKQVPIGRVDDETSAWVEKMSANEFNVGGVIEAPPDAAEATVCVKFTCLAPNLKTKLWLDAFEMVEIGGR